MVDNGCKACKSSRGLIDQREVERIGVCFKLKLNQQNENCVICYFCSSVCRYTACGYPHFSSEAFHKISQLSGGSDYQLYTATYLQTRENITWKLTKEANAMMMLSKFVNIQKLPVNNNNKNETQWTNKCYFHNKIIAFICSWYSDLKGGEITQTCQ